MTHPDTCDGCGSKMVSPPDITRWGLVLLNQYTSGVVGVTDDGIGSVDPVLNGASHFCGLSCLRKWLDKMGYSE